MIYLVIFFVCSSVFSKEINCNNIDINLNEIKSELNSIQITIKNDLDTEDIKAAMKGSSDDFLENSIFSKQIQFKKALEQSSLSGKNIETHLNKKNDLIAGELKRAEVLQDIDTISSHQLGTSNKKYFLRAYQNLLPTAKNLPFDTENYSEQVADQPSLESFSSKVKEHLLQPEVLLGHESESELIAQIDRVDLEKMQDIYDDWIVDQEGDTVFEGTPRTCHTVIGKGVYNTCTNKGIFQKISKISSVDPKEFDIANPYFREGFCIPTGRKKSFFKTTYHFCCFKSPIEKAYQLKNHQCQKGKCPGIPIKNIEDEMSFDKEWFDDFVVQWFDK